MMSIEGLVLLTASVLAGCAGAVVLPVPHFHDMGPGAQGEEAAQVASPPASGALPTAPPLDI